MADKIKDEISIEELNKSEEQKEAQNKKITQEIYKALSAEKRNRTFFNETIIKDNNDEPTY